MKIVKLIDNPSVIEAYRISIIGIMIFRIWKRHKLRFTKYDCFHFEIRNSLFDIRYLFFENLSGFPARTAGRRGGKKNLDFIDI
ncbi:MAG: hypothetical protein JYX80_05165 [Candidatus Scalindua sediminis]|nr:hypothetical protein [Candidatus Scalindua sediminis]